MLTSAWRTPSITRFVQWVGAAILVFALAVASGAGTASAPGSSAGVDKGAVARFLSQLRQAQTGEQASALLAGAKFSEDELRQLDRELAKPEWTQKLAGLQQTVKRSTPARPTLRVHKGKSVSQVLDEKRQTLLRAHRECIQRGEQALRARATAPRATTGLSARVQKTARTAGMTGATLPSTTVRAQVQRPQWPSHISDLDPRTPIVGQPLTIIGSGFGSDRGTVTFLVGEHLFEAEVTGWTSQIVIQVADDISRLQAMSGGAIKVTNRLRREAVRIGVSFVPAEDAQEVQGRKAVVMCHPAGHPLFCWVGDRREFTAFDFQLRNGWTVDECWIDVREIGVNAGAYFERQAERGDTHAYAKDGGVGGWLVARRGNALPGH